jgi:hypothetical protein
MRRKSIDVFTSQTTFFVFPLENNEKTVTVKTPSPPRPSQLEGRTRAG